MVASGYLTVAKMAVAFPRPSVSGRVRLIAKYIKQENKVLKEYYQST